MVTCRESVNLMLIVIFGGGIFRFIKLGNIDLNHSRSFLIFSMLTFPKFVRTSRQAFVMVTCSGSVDLTLINILGGGKFRFIKL